MFRKAGILFSLGASAFSWACIWDDDTLAIEAKGLPTLTETLVGRIPLNPPEYYEARVKHSQRRLAKNPNDFAAYDNIAMAHDRLGRFEEALQTLDAKLARMDATRVKPTADPMHDPRYRYHANRGTVYAHMWLNMKPAPTDTKLLDQALAELGKGLKINPNAHFGREKVQVEILTLIRKMHQNPALQIRERWLKMREKLGERAITEGIIGIIVLGTGMENRDYITMLGHCIPFQDAHVYSVAYFRNQELAARGVPSRLNLPPLPPPDAEPRRPELLKSDYVKLRANSDTYRAKRADYIRAELAAGRFPDEPGFWSQYKEPPPYEMENPNPPYRPTLEHIVLAVLGVPLIAAGGISWGIRRLRNRAESSAK